MLWGDHSLSLKTDVGLRSLFLGHTEDFTSQLAKVFLILCELMQLIRIIQAEQ